MCSLRNTEKMPADPVGLAGPRALPLPSSTDRPASLRSLHASKHPSHAHLFLFCQRLVLWPQSTFLLLLSTTRPPLQLSLSLSPCHHLFPVTLLAAWLRLEACQEFFIGNTTGTVIISASPGRDPGLRGASGADDG